MSSGNAVPLEIRLSRESLEKCIGEMARAYVLIDADPPAIVCSREIRKMLMDSVRIKPLFAMEASRAWGVITEEYQGLPVVVLSGAQDGTVFVTSLKQAKELLSIWTLRRSFYVMAQELGI